MAEGKSSSAVVVTHPVILYDAVCGLCDRLNQFVLKRDGGDHFRFASLQGEFASRVLQRHGVQAGLLDTVYVALSLGRPEERLLGRSEAVIYILRDLGGLWRFTAALFKLLPSGLRDSLYNLVARHRYRVFGRHDVCLVPDAKWAGRFLDIQSDLKSR